MRIKEETLSLLKRPNQTLQVKYMRQAFGRPLSVSCFSGCVFLVVKRLVCVLFLQNSVQVKDIVKVVEGSHAVCISSSLDHHRGKD